MALNAIGIDNFLAWVCQLAGLWSQGDKQHWGAVHLCLCMCGGNWTPEHCGTPSLQKQHSGLNWTRLPSVLAGIDNSEFSLNIRKRENDCPFFLMVMILVFAISPQNPWFNLFIGVALPKCRTTHFWMVLSIHSGALLNKFQFLSSWRGSQNIPSFYWLRKWGMRMLSSFLCLVPYQKILEERSLDGPANQHSNWD